MEHARRHRFKQVAPVGRTFQEWKQDSISHGWPSFRSEEVIKGNSHINDDGEVKSKCGTHLGTYDPDNLGPRWCLDLMCLAGSPGAQ